MADVDDTQGGGGTGSIILNPNVILASSGYTAQNQAQSSYNKAALNQLSTMQQNQSEAAASHDAIGAAATATYKSAPIPTGGGGSGGSGGSGGGASGSGSGSGSASGSGSGSGGTGGSGGTYMIQSGDTLGAIAKRYGTTVDVLADLNGITDPNKIYAGKTLKLPGGGTPTETPAVAAPVPVQAVTDPEGTDPIVVDDPVASSDDATGAAIPQMTADGGYNWTNTFAPDWRQASDSTKSGSNTATSGDEQASDDNQSDVANEALAGGGNEDQENNAGGAEGVDDGLPGSSVGEDNRSDVANEALAGGGNEDQENNAGGAEGVDDGLPGSSVGEDNRSDAANEALADGWEGNEEDGSVMPEDVITPDDPVAEAGTEPTPGTGMHIVMPGDTLSEIAQYYGTDVDTLVRLNNVENRNLIHPGQVLQLPDGAGAGAVGAGTDESAGTYTVVVGDTLSAIAEKHGYGGDYMSLAKENNLANPDLILPGQRLKIGGANANSTPDDTLSDTPSVVGYTEDR